MQEKHGFIYLWRDKKKNMYYIGSHWGTEDDGYVCSSNWMYKANKRRPEDFKRRIIARIYTSRTDMLDEEQRWISMIKPEERRIRYYNINLSVHYPWHAHENIEKEIISKKISDKKTGKNTGTRPKEVGEAISKAKKKKFQEKVDAGLPKFTAEHIEKIASQHRGKKHTEEWKQDQSERVKGQWASGQRNSDSLKGIKRSEETCRNISESLKGKPLSDAHKKAISDHQKGKPNIALKNKWADLVWAANQRQKLKEGSAKRYGKIAD
jgi:hypothetical protein